MTNDTLATVRARNQQWTAAREAERAAALELRDAVRAARAAGHSLATIGRELGVSRQRVEKLSK